VVCNKAKTMAKVEVGEMPIFTPTANPCGSKGIFGECRPTFEVTKTCVGNKELRDGLCYSKSQ
jgi:hypothetical protein